MHPTYPVLIVHGYYATKQTNTPLHRFLRKHGYRTFNVGLPGLNFQDMRISSAAVGKRVDEILAKESAQKLILVGVSMGGLICAHYIRARGGASKVEVCVTLGTPFQGSPLAPVGQAISGFTATAARQIMRGSKFIQEINKVPENDAPIVSIGAVGDPLVPEDSVPINGGKTVISPHGRWPAGHYYLVLDPRNLRMMLSHFPHDPIH